MVPQYPVELKGSFWGVTTFFNPHKYKSKYENYKIFRNTTKRQGLKLITVELVFDDEDFEIDITETDILVRLKIEKENWRIHCCWQYIVIK